MKKRSWVMIVLAISILASGCAGRVAEEVIVVEEIPIEQKTEPSENESGNAEEPENTGDLGSLTEQSQEPEHTGGSDALAEQSQELQKETKEASEEAKEVYEEAETEVEVIGNKGTITIGTTGAPFTELLTQAKMKLAKEGWNLRMERYDDYQKLNEDVLNGTLDAHLFAHQTYVDSYNDVHGTNLSSVDKICYEVYGVYSTSNQDLTKISAGAAKVAVPKDDTRKARALLFMDDLGWITLKEDVGLTAILDDIVENPNNLRFEEYTQETIQQVMGESDYCIIGADMAILAGLDVEEDILKKEASWYSSAALFASLLVTSEENMENPKLDVLIQALKSDAVKEYADETYQGALALFP